MLPKHYSSSHSLTHSPAQGVRLDDPGVPRVHHDYVMPSGGHVLERLDGRLVGLDEGRLEVEPVAGGDQRLEHGVILAECN